MLYGYIVNDGQIRTFIVAADTITELNNWVGQLVDDTDPLYTDIFEPSIVDMMMDDDYSCYKHKVITLTHTSTEQQTSLIEKHNILIKGKNFCLGRHDEMIQLQKEFDELDTDGLFSSSNKGKSISEIYDLKENDRWDNRSDKEKESDKKLRERMKKAQSRGDISGDSFAGPSEEKSNEDLNKTFKDDVVVVTDVRVDIDKTTGKVEIDNVLARKKSGNDEEGPSVQERREQRLKELKAKGIDPSTFSPEDFASALRGDGSKHSTGGPIIEGDSNLLKGTIDGKVTKKVRDARKILKEEEKQQEREKEEQIEKGLLEQDLEDQKNGLFRGCDLLGIKTVTDDFYNVPEMFTSGVRDAIAKSIEAAKAEIDPKAKKKERKTTEVILLKNYPYSSILGGKYIIPMNLDNENSIIYTENVKIDGKISIGLAKVYLLTKENDQEPGWVIYKLPNVNYNIVKLR